MIQDLQFAARMLVKNKVVHAGRGAGPGARHRPECDGVHVRERRPDPRPAVPQPGADLPYRRPDQRDHATTSASRGWISRTTGPERRPSRRSRPIGPPASRSPRAAGRRSGSRGSTSPPTPSRCSASRRCIGRGFMAGEDKKDAPPVVILGYGVWQSRYGGDAGIVGRVIRVNEVSLHGDRRHAGRHEVSDQCGRSGGRSSPTGDDPRDANTDNLACSAGSRRARTAQAQPEIERDRARSSSGSTRTPTRTSASW